MMVKNAGIILLGLGPGSPDHLTRQAWQVLENASEVYLRTHQHPVVDALPAQLQIHSFDNLFVQSETFAEGYAQIVDRILDLGQRDGGVIYAVPGNPLIAEATSPEIARRARSAGIPIRIISGLSFLETTFEALEQDPFPQTVLVDGLELGMSLVPPFPADLPAIIAQIQSRQVASGVKLTLMTNYPDDHPVFYVHAAGMEDCKVERIPLNEIDQIDSIGLLATLYVPPLSPSYSFERFQHVIARLRAPDGCPWDRQQTHESLRAGLLEETYEVLAALDNGDLGALQEELGDLLLHIVMQVQIAEEYGEFRMGDVLHGIHTKIVHRHPHVFGDLKLENAEEVLSNWDRLKAEEKRENGQKHESVMDGVAHALPALQQAKKYQERAERAGINWQSVVQRTQKWIQWLGELPVLDEEAEGMLDIYGELLFVLVNQARLRSIDLEIALRQMNRRFRNQVDALLQEGRNLEHGFEDFSSET